MVAEVPLPPYNPYDPEQNQLLLITPSWRNPIMTKERVDLFLDVAEPALALATKAISIRSAMTRVEYITCYYWLCNNPEELSEPAFTDELRQDFSVQVKAKYQPQTTQVKAELSPKFTM